MIGRYALGGKGKVIKYSIAVPQCPPHPKCTLCTQLGKGQTLLLASVSLSIRSGARPDDKKSPQELSL